MSRSFAGSPAFPEGARVALANPQLRATMANATHTIRAKRDRVVAELDTWEDLRLAGEAIKAAALGDLDRLLVQFEERVLAAGGHVHWASDGAHASRMAVDLVRATGVTGVVKVKSMTTTEIGLNQALEAVGITAYETDLAELIVQLGDDLPSHIVVPAIHRSRGEIRTTFADHMGEWGRPAPAGLSDEPADLAATARLHLRERFLAAEVGISGANFLVAETGSVAIVESEGNGRMCLTLPQTLITIAGIDKVIPRFEDLDVFFQLLPRSATGERMNPYTSVWTGVHPGDGPRELHVILLDNGRSSALGDTVGRQALRCIRCAACLNVCPVYERVGGHAYGSVYPGPIGAVLTPQLDHIAGDDVAASLPYASTLCGACFDACPVRIDIPRLLVHLRGEVVDAHRSALPTTQEQAVMRGASWALATPRRLQALTRLGVLARRAVGPRRLRLPGWLDGWSATRTTPLPSEESFSAWWSATHAPDAPGTPSEDGGGGGTAGGGRRLGGGSGRLGGGSGRLGGGSGRLGGGSGRLGRPQRVGIRRRNELRRRISGRPAGLLASPAVRPERGSSPEVAPAASARPGSRAEVLAAIRRSLAPAPATTAPGGTDRGTRDGTAGEAAMVPRSYRRAAGPRPDDLVALFVDRVTDYRATVTRCSTGDLPGVLDRILAGVATTGAPTDLPAGWLSGSGGTVRLDQPAMSVAALDRLDAVVTGCAVGIAETGTVVLDGGPGQGRRALTLVPDHHVVVIDEAQIVAGVPDAFPRLRSTGPQTWISGPSATSDIELNRVEGVHGPRRLDVVITGEPAPARS